MVDDEKFMHEAIAEAERGRAAGELPYGSVLVDAAGQIIGRSFDTVEGDGDPTAHAEFKVARESYLARGGALAGCTMYSSAEPCAMCFGSAWYSGVSRVVYGVSAAELKRLFPQSQEEVFGSCEQINALLERQVEIVSGVLRDECLALWPGEGPI
jgi:tRNA(Arg) A34 adenosine deaminase TadA